MVHNMPEVEWEEEYFAQYPYAVEIFCGDTCEDIYRTDSLSNAQAKFDKWEQDLSAELDHCVKMFKYDTNLVGHVEIDYNGNEV